MPLPSEFDNHHIPISRKFIDDIRELFIDQYVKPGDLLLDIGNQGKYKKEKKYQSHTFDITNTTSPDILGDITTFNSKINNETYDSVICTEVLEHVVDPFSAIEEIKRITKIGGHVLFTTPLNARIHGPIPDCWRFTEFGLKVLLRDFEMVDFQKLDTPGRNLFPLHYGCIVKKITDKKSDPRILSFKKID